RRLRPGSLLKGISASIAYPPSRGASTIGIPSAVEIWLWAGRPGSIASRAAVVPYGTPLRPAEGIPIVEAPRDGGYAIEALIPFSKLPGRNLRRSRASARMQDVDTEPQPGGPGSERAPRRQRPSPHLTSPAIHPEHLPALRPIGRQSEVLGTFLNERGLNEGSIRFDFYGDVTGDAEEEQVVVAGRYVAVLGSRYRRGQGYDYLTLPVSSARDVLHAELVDVTGDMQGELLLQLRQHRSRGRRTLLYIARFDRGSIEAIFLLETYREIDGESIETRTQIHPSPDGAPGAPTLIASVDTSEGLSRRDHHFLPATDVEPMLLPWGPVHSRSYRWSDAGFHVVAETPNPRYEASSSRDAVREQTRPSEPKRAPQASPRLQASPRPQASAEGASQEMPHVEELLQLARTEWSLSARESNRRNVDLTGDDRLETLVLYDTTLVVVGPGFRSGVGYFAWSLPVEDASDIVALHCADVTGDGAEELFLTLAQHLPNLEPETTRQVVLGYRFPDDAHFSRMLAVEIARFQAGRQIINHIAYAEDGVEITAGEASGWNALNWPFQEGTGDGVDPILLPWQDTHQYYRFEGSRLVRTR
ncbi:MAG: hypothetical protein AAF550_11115, partial [Myxococcota bacterium]